MSSIEAALCGGVEGTIATSTKPSGGVSYAIATKCSADRGVAVEVGRRRLQRNGSKFEEIDTRELHVSGQQSAMRAHTVRPSQRGTGIDNNEAGVSEQPANPPH